MGAKKKGKEKDEMNDCAEETNNDGANAKTSGNKKSIAQIGEEKANEQSEGDPVEGSNSSEYDTAKRNSQSSRELFILGKGTENGLMVFIVLGIIWILSLFTRLYDISQPAKICWDETHFGKFASHYINGKFFFDVHPPLGKMLLALAGWMSGYGGGFPFDKPGDAYGEEKYVGMRTFCSLLGGFCVPLALLIVYEMTKSLPAAIISASLILFDHGALTLSRFILLDAILMFFMMMAIFCLVKFRNMCDRPFSVEWWGWMLFTGFFLACTFSVKWVGLFVILLAGLATIKELWDLLGDLNLSMFVISLHFMARVIGLILLPIFTYMFFFGVHFMALPLSGNGDGFFSSRFQSTLHGNNLYQAVLPKELAYGSVITLKNTKPGGVLLHSHQHLYPKEHPPEQQQITGYSHKDPNNDWLVKKPSNHKLDPNAPLEYVRDGDIIRLEHVMTTRNLHSHNEKAPLTKNLMQVTGYGDKGHGDSNDDWKIVATSEVGEDSKISSVRTTFKLIHANTGCALGETTQSLPKWGWDQREMACYPDKDSPGTTWNVEGHVNDKVPLTNVEMMAPSFLEKIFESHIIMAQTNNGFKPKEGELTSRPWQWPINYRGQVFSGGDQRVYLLGNPVIWWGIVASFIIFVVVYFYHAVREQRGYIYDITAKAKRDNTMQSCIFFIIGWALHYFPFYAMGRVLYFHHYFPAYLLSAMFSGIFIEYLCFCIAACFKTAGLQKKTYSIVFSCLLLCIVLSFYAFRGLTYGMSGPMGNDPNATQAAYKWLESWEI